MEPLFLAVMCACNVGLLHDALNEVYLPRIQRGNKELNDMNALALALYFASVSAVFERKAAEAERLASELIELSTRYNFAFWFAGTKMLRGWARSASGDTIEGLSWIEQGIEDYRAAGALVGLSIWLALKAEALYLADRTSEALDTISEAEGLVERFEVRWWSAELQRLRGVFLTAMGAKETEIETSFRDKANSSIANLEHQIEQLQRAGSLADQIPKMSENLVAVASAVRDTLLAATYRAADVASLLTFMAYL